MKTKFVLLASAIFFIGFASSICNAQSAQSLIKGKWKCAGKPIFVPEFYEFKADSILKVSAGDSLISVYKFYVNNGTICLKSKTGENKLLHISKLNRDTLQMDVMGVTISYLRTKS